MRFWPWAEIADLKARAAKAEELVRRVCDDQLAAAGRMPIWSPDDPRHRPRPLAVQLADQQRHLARPRAGPAAIAAFERREREAAREQARAQLNEAMSRLTPREEEAGTEE